jgi:equilibrative nucleoside transporter 1/2/3
MAGVRSILRQTWPQAYSVAAIYAVTLSIFPGFLAEDVSSAALGDWYPVVLIATFDLADVVGKMAPGWFPHLAVRLTPTRLVGLSTARLLFIPAFLMVTKHGPAALSRPEAPCVVLTLALGLTNGWYSSVAMMQGPKMVAAHEAETCGTVMVFFLLIGLAVGALCGWLWLL